MLVAKEEFIQVPQLPNFPMKSQRRSPDANQDFDCVSTCIASALQFETGRDFEPNAVKDTVYGAGYVGATSAANFASYAAQQGVHLYSIDSTDPHSLMWSARQILTAKSHPIIITEPDPYADPKLGWWHVVEFYKWDAASITAMDPWTGGDITHTDAEWQALLQTGQIWSTEKIAPTLLSATPDELHDWSVFRKDVPLVIAHAIPQSWLRGVRRGFNFGPVMEFEYEVMYGTTKFMEMRCAGAKASWNSITNVVTWWTSHGPVVI